MHSSTRIKKRSNLDGSCDVDVLLEGEEGKEDGKRSGRERRRVEGEKVEKEGRRRKKGKEQGKRRDVTCLIHTYITN